MCSVTKAVALLLGPCWGPYIPLMSMYCLTQILPGDQQLIAACEDRSWSLWNIDQEKCCGQYTTAMGGVRSVAAVGDQVCSTTSMCSDA